MRYKNSWRAPLMVLITKLIIQILPKTKKSTHQCECVFDF